MPARVDPVVIDALRSACAEGLCQKEAAVRAGVSRSTVAKYAKLLRLKFPHGNAVSDQARAWKGERRKARHKRALQMSALYRAGYTLQQIGDSYGVTRERVRQLLAEIGVTANEGGGSVRAARKRALVRAQKDAQFLAKYGCTFSQWQELVRIGREMMAEGCSRERTPTGAFHSQRRNAAHRGIGWELTLWQWWTIWQQSGRWEQRGRGQGYVMCRYGDTGPYAVGNVFIATSIENASTRRNKRSGLPTGVSRANSGRYTAQRQIDGKLRHLGTFPTPEIAHAAYLAAAPQSGVAA